MSDITPLKTTEISVMRKKIHNEQDMICPVCQENIPHDLTTLDHQHKLFKDQPLLEDGAGMIRGVLCRNCNSFEGKVFNSHRRLGLHKKELPLYDLLRNLADYLARPNLPYIHPTEMPKKETMGIRRFKKLNKAYCLLYPKKKPLEYPKSKKLTDKLAKLLEEFKI